MIAIMPLSGRGQEEPDIDADLDKIERLIHDHHYPIKLTVKAVGPEGDAIGNANVRIGIDSLVHADGFNHFTGAGGVGGLCSAAAVKPAPSRAVSRRRLRLCRGTASDRTPGGGRGWAGVRRFGAASRMGGMVAPRCGGLGRAVGKPPPRETAATVSGLRASCCRCRCRL